MKTLKASNYLKILLIAAVAFGCSPHFASSEKQPSRQISQYHVEGSDSRSPADSRPFPTEIRKLPFEKMIDVSHLRFAFTHELDESFAYLDSIGIKVVSTQSNPGHGLGSIEEPENLAAKEIWNEFATTDDISGIGTLGLAAPVGTLSKNGNEILIPTIIVLNVPDKFTLIHELSHALIDQQSNSGPVPNALYSREFRLLDQSSKRLHSEGERIHFEANNRNIYDKSLDVLFGAPVTEGYKLDLVSLEVDLLIRAKKTAKADFDVIQDSLAEEIIIESFLKKFALESGYYYPDNYDYAFRSYDKAWDRVSGFDGIIENAMKFSMALENPPVLIKMLELLKELTDFHKSKLNDLFENY